MSVVDLTGVTRPLFLDDLAPHQGGEVLVTRPQAVTLYRHLQQQVPLGDHELPSEGALWLGVTIRIKPGSLPALDMEVAHDRDHTAKQQMHLDTPAIPGIITGDWVVHCKRSYPQWSIEKDDYLVVSEHRPDVPWLLVVDPDGKGVTVREADDQELGEVRGFVVGLYRGFER